MPVDDQMYTAMNDYVTELFAPEDAALRTTQVETRTNGMPQISLSAYEGRLLQFLVTSVGTRSAVEIGTLAGYSGTWIARALPADGKLYTLEVSSKHAEVARASFERAGLSERIELIEGPALESLRKLEARGPFDFVFIDADKGTYPQYLDWAIENLRIGGMVAAHNAFREGRVFTPRDAADHAMDAFNRRLATDPRLSGIILAVGDGMAAAIRKA